MIQWLASKVGGKLAARAIVALGVCVIVASLYGAGFWNGYRQHELKSDVKALKEEVAVANVQMDQLEEMHHENAAVVANLGEAKQSDRVSYRQLRIEARAVADSEKPTGDRTCSYSGNFVRLWDRALEPDLQGATSRAADTTSNTGDLEGVDQSEVTSTDLLDNHIENAERSRANWRQCSAIIQWHRRNDRTEVR